MKQSLLIFLAFLILVIVVAVAQVVINMDLNSDSLKKQNLIRLDQPKPNQEISSPLVVRGEARGYWFFEASFPVRLLDGNGNEISLNPPYIMTASEWMTEDFVPFEAMLTFVPPSTREGTLILEKDNPSGLPENADELRVPVKFSEGDGCIVTGCSGQVCAEEEVITTCEFRPEYACYKDAVCERQANGECGWTETEKLRRCLLQ